jgi:hypothetical protein
LSAGIFENLLASFDITATDNAGNTISYTSEDIDNTTISVDNDVPSGLTFTGPAETILSGTGHTLT